ncbi:MAG: WD40 repeat domain-containing protein [Oscillochloridaceae bacterium]|nr:WD40 repeat domain-containing protein [Chloroflexaceae bacterium]MDW8390702.1 WD40 repeat domain-containing protein [Oscillochloridaceae bacterium]
MQHYPRLLTLLLALALTACASPPSAATPVPTATMAPLAPTAAVIAPTAPTVPTTVPEALPSPLATPELPATRLGPETVGRIARLRSIGLGGFASFALSDDALVVGTTAGIAWLRLPDLKLARFEAVGAAYDLALSPGGALLAHATPGDNEQGRAVLRRAADAAPIAELRGGTPRFAPDGNLLATSSPSYQLEDGVTWLWRATDGARVAELPGNAPRFSDDGRYLATVENRLTDPSITRVYPAGDNQPVLEVEGAAPAFSPDGGRVAVVLNDRVTIYSLPDGAKIIGVPGSLVSAVAFSPDGRDLLSVDGPDLIVWDLAAGRERRRLAGVNRAGDLPPAEEPRFAPRRDTLATLTPLLGDCPPGGARVSATTDGAVRYEDDASVSVVYAPDGKRIALGRNGQVRVADLAGGAVVERDLAAYTDIAFSPDGATLALAAVVSDENSRPVGQVELWNVATGTQRAVLATAPEDFVFALSGLRFSPDGRRVSVLARYGCAAIGFSKIVTWNIADGTILSAIGDLPPAVDEAGNPLDSAPQALAFAPDGSAAAWRGPEGNLVLRRPNGEERTLKTPADPSALAFTDDGATLAIGVAAGEVWLLTVGDGALRNVGRTGSLVEALSFGPDGARLVGLAGGAAFIWDVAQGVQLDRWPVAPDASEPRLSADGQLLLVNTPGGPVFYATASGQQAGALKTPASAMALGPEQRLAATISGGQALLWGAPSP